MSLLEKLTGQTTVQGALRTASRSTGADFDYLLNTAKRESSLDPKATARTSSAAGLFQFIESTWLETLKEAGDRFGFAKEAQQIAKTDNGRYVVPNAKDREAILDLRHDPRAAALMAGALAERNAERLSDRLGRAPNEAELYMAHFMGASGAARLISLAAETPDADAATAFPREARANPAIFKGKGGEARSVSQVYDHLARQHDATPIAVSNVVAARSGAQPAEADLSQPILDKTGFFSGQSADNGNVFHALFSGAGQQIGTFFAGFFTNAAEGRQDAPAAANVQMAATAAPAQTHAVDQIVAAWMANGDAPGAPLDLALAARLYRSGTDAQ